MIRSEKVLVFDVDGTLCEIRRPEQSYADVEPIWSVVDKLKEYSRAGFYIAEPRVAALGDAGVPRNSRRSVRAGLLAGSSFCFYIPDCHADSHRGEASCSVGSRGLDGWIGSAFAGVERQGL